MNSTSGSRSLAGLASLLCLLACASPSKPTAAEPAPALPQPDEELAIPDPDEPRVVLSADECIPFASPDSIQRGPLAAWIIDDLFKACSLQGSARDCEDLALVQLRAQAPPQCVAFYLNASCRAGGDSACLLLAGLTEKVRPTAARRAVRRACRLGNELACYVQAGTPDSPPAMCTGQERYRCLDLAAVWSSKHAPAERFESSRKLFDALCRSGQFAACLGRSEAELLRATTALELSQALRLYEQACMDHPEACCSELYQLYSGDAATDSHVGPACAARPYRLREVYAGFEAYINQAWALAVAACRVGASTDACTLGAALELVPDSKLSKAALDPQMHALLEQGCDRNDALACLGFIASLPDLDDVSSRVGSVCSGDVSLCDEALESPEAVKLNAWQSASLSRLFLRPEFLEPAQRAVCSLGGPGTCATLAMTEENPAEARRLLRASCPDSGPASAFGCHALAERSAGANKQSFIEKACSLGSEDACSDLGSRLEQADKAQARRWVDVLESGCVRQAVAACDSLATYFSGRDEEAASEYQSRAYELSTIKHSM